MTSSHFRQLPQRAASTAILDSQSVRTASQPGLRGFDAGKKITGRKRPIRVDTFGFILALKVTPADVQDRDGARLLLAMLTTAYDWIVQSRRLIHDHEVRIEHSEALIYLSMTKRMPARIAAGAFFRQPSRF